MITTSEATEVKTSGIGQVAQATVKNSAKIFNFFSNQVYSNKYVAIWRELVANGIDAQKINGVTKSPIVTLPSALDPVASVRDFGTGMGHEFMMEKFMAFTDASTKEDSNEFIGGFGIGSKAPLAYTEQYSIKCYQQGTVRVYSVFKDESGCPSIAFLAEDATEEPDGVEVKFPVRQDDIEPFNEVVQDTLKYFDPQPVLANTELKIEPIEYDARGKNWGIDLKDTHGQIQVIMGGVAYPFNSYSMSYSDKAKYPNLTKYDFLKIDVYLPIGSANISLSRESITLDENLYHKMNKVIEGVEETLGDQVKDKLAACDTLWDAKVLLAQMFKDSSYNKREFIRENSYYQGNLIATQIGKPEDTPGLAYILYGSYYNGQHNYSMKSTCAANPSFKIWDPVGNFSAETVEKILICDTGDRPILRIRKFIEENPDVNFIALRDNSEDKSLDMKKILDSIGSPPEDMVDYVSNYDPIKVIRMAGTTQSRPFKCYVDRRPYRGSGSRDALPEVTTGIYVEMDNFNIIDNESERLMANLLEYDRMVYLNQTDLKASDIKNKKEWLSVSEAAKKVLDDYKSKNKRLAWAAAWDSVCRSNCIHHRLSRWIGLDKFPKSGPLYQLSKLYLEFKDVRSASDYEVRKMLGVKYEDQLKKINKLCEDAESKYPLIFELYQADAYVSKDLMNNNF